MTKKPVAKPAKKNLVKKHHPHLVPQSLRMTAQRELIMDILYSQSDHPDVETVYHLAKQRDQSISLATCYRTLKLFEESGLVKKHDFGDKKARYEISNKPHHDHLIDVSSGKVIEFCNEEIERLQGKVAKQLGYELLDHRLELYGRPLKNKTSPKK